MKISLIKKRLTLAIVVSFLFGIIIFTANSVYAHDANDDGVRFNQADAEWRRMELWKTGATSGTTCEAACGRGYCLVAYVDDARDEKIPITQSTPNKNCICVGRR